MAAFIQLVAAAGQRLLLQAAPAPAPEEAAAPASAAATNDTGGYDVRCLPVWLPACQLLFPVRHAACQHSACRHVHPTCLPPPPLQVSFSTSSCMNTTSPICYSTAISGENLITGWVGAEGRTQLGAQVLVVLEQRALPQGVGPALRPVTPPLLLPPPPLPPAGCG